MNTERDFSTVQAGMAPVPACPGCGHPWARHGGSACSGAGWAPWVARPCACTAFPVGGWAWPPDGITDCAGCGHSEAAHADGAHCRVAAEDERDDCRCTGYRAPADGSGSAVAR